ncbi:MULTISPECIES: ADP-ribosylglycohydrolase family protein [unclassified Acutalibacter]|jgi:ADP-ribosylglycohydrolase|uniref:ADP-ribosylglycohydrolase family protein n=1 Tax=unclassified Acutalibacter TaxID=2620728 RepID=UPI0025BDCA81|nr:MULTISPECIES: ADP-ribosylglycohydrolase family protein [unclassified Acutalibacter]
MDAKEPGVCGVYGAILGDIAGSRFEFTRPEKFDWRREELFNGMSKYTDDTVLTIATKYAVLTGVPYFRAYQRFGRRYMQAGYGPMFKNWLHAHSEKGYNSYGNGSAMRVSYIGLYFDTLEDVEREARQSSVCTHDHYEGIRAAIATAAAVFMARTGASKAEIAYYMRRRYKYTVARPLFLYRPFGKFDVTAMGTMPLAIRCFLESEDWESCIRNVYSVRCDTDTVGCIAGGIADAFYGGTGQDEDALLRRYLIRPNRVGAFDTYLYDWAVKTPEEYRQEKEEKGET